MSENNAIVSSNSSTNSDVPAVGSQVDYRTGGPISNYDVLEELLQPRGPSLKDFVTLLIKRRKIVIGCALTIMTLGAFYAFTSPDQFTATSVIEIQGYAPVLSEGQLESMLQTDTRKITYQPTTVAKLTLPSFADKVLSSVEPGTGKSLGARVHTYFRKQRSLLSKFIGWNTKFFLGRGQPDSPLDSDDPRYEHKWNFLNSYLRLIQITPIHETSLVQIRATTTDKRLSQQIANEHAEGLMNLLATERRAELGAHLQTLKAHAEELQKKLSEAENQVAQYAQEHKLVGLVDSSQGNLMLSHLTDINKLLTTAQKQRIESESKVGQVSAQPKATTTSLLDDETVKDLRTKLKDAESEYAALSKLVTGEYPKLVELQGKIDSLRSNIKTEREGNLSALKMQYESDLASEQLLVKQFEDQLRKALDMSSQLVQYNFLQRESSSLRELTQTVLKALNETQIGAASSKSNARISNYAPLPRSPSAPRRGIILVFSAVLGIMVGLGLAVLIEVLDSTIKVSDDAQAALGLPTFGIIPSFPGLGNSAADDEDLSWQAKLRLFASKTAAQIGYKKETKNSSSQTGQATSDLATSDLATSGPVTTSPTTSGDEVRRPLISGIDGNAHLPAASTVGAGTLTLPEAAIKDALRTLRANILFSSTHNLSRVIMVASSREREGKTSVITNLSVTFARSGQRTVMIDGDFRRPKVARRFGISSDQLGLVDYLAGQADLAEIFVPSGIDNLIIVPAGSPTLNPTELLGSEKMVQLINSLRSEFDVILFDSAPVLPVADALVLAQLAETVLFVVRSGKTEKAVAQDAIRRLRRVGARVRGIVLNDFDPGVGSYSSDRYSVSPYSFVEAKGARDIIRPKGDFPPPPVEPGNNSKQAVG